MSPSPPRRRERVQKAVALVLALAVAVLIGMQLGRHPEPEPPPPCPEVPACVCPLDEVVEAEPVPRRPGIKRLPAAPGPSESELRRRLLAWVRRKSVALQACRGEGRAVYRLAVTLGLDDAGKIQRVALSASGDEVPVPTLACLKKSMGSWKLPPELSTGRQEVVFGLSL